MVKRIKTQELTPFPCTACGKCCRQVHRSEHTTFLDRGDGICRHFNTQTNLCTIYHDRPLVCRVEDYYKVHLSDKISWEDFVKLNLEICNTL